MRNWIKIWSRREHKLVIKRGSDALILIIILMFSFGSVTAQPLTLPFEQSLRIEQERGLLDSSKIWHAVYPFRTEVDSRDPAYSDLADFEQDSSRSKFRSWVTRKLFYESFIQIDSGAFRLRIDPMVLFEVGKQLAVDQAGDPGDTGGAQILDALAGGDGRNTWVNTRGVRVDGSIGRQVAFHTAFYESQAVLPTWLDAQTKSLRVVPGQAMYKGFKENGFDYAFAEGHVSYSPSRYFNFRLGHGKNFLGDGYRSLLLSDAAFNYPYLAVNTRVWNIEYVNIYSQMMDISAPKSGVWQPWQKKYTTTHYLSWHVLPWLNIGLFESIVWQAADSTGQRGFDINYLNPVIFYRPVEFSLGSPDNALMGGSIRMTVLKRNFLYFQLLLDEFKLEHVLKGDGWWANKHGFQAGVKSYDPFGLRNLFIQAEYNHVRPYTYSHNSTLQNYAHYNQPLAHPQGANFREFVLLLNQRIRRWQLNYKLVYATYGADTAGFNYGHDVYKPYLTYITEFGNEIGQGLKTTLAQHDLNAGYIINPTTNLKLSIGLTLHHRFSSVADENNLLIWIGLRSAVFNRYYDF